MKLYEFTFNDNTNLTESEILESLAEGLANEALIQGWAPGYNLRQCRKPVHLGNGEIEYFFEVHGKTVGDIEAGGQEDLTPILPGHGGAAASSI